MAQQSGVRVKCYKGLNDPELRRVWAELEQTGTVTAFHTLEFADLFVKYVLPAHKASLLVFQLVDADGASLMLLPMVYRRWRGVRFIESYDLDLVDYVMPLLAKDYAAKAPPFGEVWALIKAQMPKTDIIDLKKMPFALAGIDNPLVSIAGVRDMGVSSHPIPVKSPEDVKVFEKSGVSADYNKRQRRWLREGHVVELLQATNPQQLEEFFTQLAILRGRRFSSLHRNDALREEDIRAFYLDMAHRGLESQKATLFALHVDGEIVAAVYGIRHAGRLILVMIGANTENWKAFSPGLISFVSIARWAIEQKLDIYDLGVGDLPYKKRFPFQHCPMFEFQQALTWRGEIFAALQRARRQARIYLEQRPKLNLWVRRIRGK